MQGLAEFSASFEAANDDQVSDEGKGNNQMRKMYLLGLALFAVLGFSVVAVASASAAVEFLLAEWLVNGNPIPAGTTDNAETTGELLLEDTKAVFGAPAAAMKCSGSLDGTLGPDGEDKITALLTLTEKDASTPLGAEAISCENETNCIEPLVWALNLPWNTLLELMVEGTETWYVDLITNGGNGEPGWEVECMGSLGKPVDDCSGPAIAHIDNIPTEGLMGEFSEPFTTLAELKLANCELGGAETGVVEGLGFTTTTAGALTASSE